MRRHQLGEAQREQRAAQRRLDDALRRQETADASGFALLRLAQREGLIEQLPDAPEAREIRRLLEHALTVPMPAVGSVQLQDQRQELGSERRELRTQLQDLDEELALVQRWKEQGQAFTGELHLQLGRLKSLGLLGAERDGGSGVCPMCAHPLDAPDPSAADIIDLTDQLDVELRRAETLQPVRDEHRRALEAKRETIVERMRVNGAQLRELAASDERMRSLQDQHLRVAHVQGRIDQALTEGGGTAASSIRALSNDLELARETVAALQQAVDEDDVAAEVERRLVEIAADMTPWAQRLNLGQASAATEVAISLSQLNVVLRLPDGRKPLTRIGSAKNWIGYHLVAHLALHTYFRRHNRPVPSFLMLDQPTQAFFPEKVRDASTVEDADWTTVTAYFALLHHVAELNEGRLQIIVCDHANLTDEEWFQDALVENWRPVNGRRRALIPTGWLD